MSRPELLLEIVAEILVATQALWFLKKHPVGWRRWGAFLALVTGVMGAGIDIARLLGRNIPDLHLDEELILYVVIWLMLQVSERLYIDQDDAAYIYKILQKALAQMEAISRRLERHDYFPR